MQRKQRGVLSKHQCNTTGIFGLACSGEKAYSLLYLHLARKDAVAGAPPGGPRHPD
jgi:hypothetical protein